MSINLFDLSINLPINPSIHLTTHLSIHQPIHPSIHLVHLVIYLYLHSQVNGLKNQVIPIKYSVRSHPIYFQTTATYGNTLARYIEHTVIPHLLT